MKRINQLLITGVMLALMLTVSAIAVLAKGGDETPPHLSAVELSAKTTHFGGAIVATAGFTIPITGNYYAVVIDWGDGAGGRRIPQFGSDRYRLRAASLYQARPICGCGHRHSAG